MASCLVTGGAGFIGSHICERLAAGGHEVRVLDSSGAAGNLAGMAGRVELVRGSILERESLRKAMDGIGFVFHEAAVVSVSESVREPEKAREVNAEGSRMVLEAAEAAGAQKAILASSAAVYGSSPPPLAETSATVPLSPYGESKLEMERIAAGFGGDLRTVSLRYFNVFGPRQSASSESGVVSRFVDLMCDSKPITIYGDGTQTRDFIYVSDVVEANMLAMRKPGADGGVLNVATGRRTSLSELVAALSRIIGRPAGVSYGPWREGDIKHSFADISRARDALGFEPGWSLEKGLEETVRWRRGLTS